MKTVNFREGMVAFEIPAHWLEDCDPQGSGRFYEEGDEAGTMRLNVLTFSRHDGVPKDEAARIIFREKAYETLANGLPLCHFLTQEEEGGELLNVYRWDVLVAVPPQHWRLVCFGYTALASQAEEPRMREELRIVNHAVRTARYSNEPAVLTRRPE